MKGKAEEDEGEEEGDRIGVGWRGKVRRTSDCVGGKGKRSSGR